MKENKDNCQKAIDQLINELDSNQSLDENKILDDLITRYPSCTEELRNQYGIWVELSNIKVPEPSDRMHKNFYKALNEVNHTTSNNIEKSSDTLRSIKWIMYSAAFLILVSSYFILMHPNEQESGPIEEVTAYVLNKEEIDELYFAIKEGETANRRIEKIENIALLNNPDDKIFEALNEALLNDRKISVRLSAIETLLHFEDQVVVREYLIMAISQQKSPIIQLTLADAMVNLNEKKSLDQFRKLLDTGNLESDVKEYLEHTVRVLL